MNEVLSFPELVQAIEDGEDLEYKLKEGATWTAFTYSDRGFELAPSRFDYRRKIKLS